MIWIATYFGWQIQTIALISITKVWDPLLNQTISTNYLQLTRYALVIIHIIYYRLSNWVSWNALWMWGQLLKVLMRVLFYLGPLTNMMLALTNMILGRSCEFQLGQVSERFFVTRFIIDNFALDRILYRGANLDLSVYSRAELKGSDHRPGIWCYSYQSHCILYWLTSTVFALMRADVRVIDTVKKAALSRLLLESVVSTGPGEKLDEKLAALTLPTDFVERAYHWLIHCVLKIDTFMKCLLPAQMILHGGTVPVSSRFWTSFRLVFTIS